MFFAHHIVAVSIQRPIPITELRILQFPAGTFIAPAQFGFRIHFIPKRILHRLATAQQEQYRAKKKNAFHTQSVMLQRVGDKFFPQKTPLGGPDGLRLNLVAYASAACAAASLAMGIRNGLQLT